MARGRGCYEGDETERNELREKRGKVAKGRNLEVKEVHLMMIPAHFSRSLFPATCSFFYLSSPCHLFFLLSFFSLSASCHSGSQTEVLKSSNPDISKGCLLLLLLCVRCLISLRPVLDSPSLSFFFPIFPLSLCFLSLSAPSVAGSRKTAANFSPSLQLLSSFFSPVESRTN